MAVENDLAELKGIGPKHAATLKEIGVARSRSCATATLPISRR